jgi:flagellar basal-body rod modification protein FlgD
MPVNGITGSTTGAAQQRTPSPAIGKDQFLKLLAGQLKGQSPMNAGGGEEMMAQMTQFAMLEQIQNMAAAQQQATTAASSTQAVGLIGKTVSYQDADGVPKQAVVERVLFAEGTPKLVLAGVTEPLGLADVQEVR